MAATHLTPRMRLEAQQRTFAEQLAGVAAPTVTTTVQLKALLADEPSVVRNIRVLGVAIIATAPGGAGSRVLAEGTGDGYAASLFSPIAVFQDPVFDDMGTQFHGIIELRAQSAALALLNGTAALDVTLDATITLPQRRGGGTAHQRLVMRLRIPSAREAAAAADDQRAAVPRLAPTPTRAVAAPNFTDIVEAGPNVVYADAAVTQVALRPSPLTGGTPPVLAQVCALNPRETLANPHGAHLVCFFVLMASRVTRVVRFETLFGGTDDAPAGVGAAPGTYVRLLNALRTEAQNASLVVPGIVDAEVAHTVFATLAGPRARSNKLRAYAYRESMLQLIASAGMPLPPGSLLADSGGGPRLLTAATWDKLRERTAGADVGTQMSEDVDYDYLEYLALARAPVEYVNAAIGASTSAASGGGGGSSADDVPVAAPMAEEDAPYLEYSRGSGGGNGGGGGGGSGSGA